MNNLEIINNKIYREVDSFLSLLNIWRFKNQKIVFTNGCFDLMHLGHIDYLSKAADLGNHLIIGLNSDKSVKDIKGDKRPITDEKSRSTLLASLHFVSAVILFDDETPLELIKAIKPDILVKGKDYEIDQIIGHDIVLNGGGKVETIEFLEGYSSTSIIKKISGL